LNRYLIIILCFTDFAPKNSFVKMVACWVSNVLHEKILIYARFKDSEKWPLIRLVSIICASEYPAAIFECSANRWRKGLPKRFISIRSHNLTENSLIFEPEHMVSWSQS